MTRSAPMLRHPGALPTSTGLVLLFAATGLLAACAKNTQPAANPCGVDGTDGGSSDDPAVSAQDALVWQSRAPGSTFLEITDVLAVDQRIWQCTGVQGLTVFDPADSSNITAVAQVDLGLGSGNYPRCQYLAWDADSQRVLVAAHSDEIQPTPWVMLVDVSEPDAPVTLDTRASTRNTEEATFFGDKAVVAAHDDGLLVLDLTGDVLTEEQLVGFDVNVHRVHALGDHLGIGTVEGLLLVVDESFTELGRIDLGTSVQDLLDLGDGRAAVALGSGGLALVDLSDPSAPVLLGQSGVEGSATKLGQLEDGHVAVSTWTDVRVFDVSEAVPVLAAVEGVLDASDDPRVLAVGALGKLVFAGEWTGLHAYEWHADRQGPELTLDRRVVKVAADGEDQSALLIVDNEGQQELIVDTLTLPEGWTAEVAEFAVAPGDDFDLWLTREGTTDVVSGDLVLCTNDPDEGDAAVTLQTGSNSITVGDEAPDFLYPALNTGQSHGLSDQRGKVVMLAYFATF